MTSDAVQHQNQYVLQHFIDKKPIRFNMAFPTAPVVAGQVMVTVFFSQWFSVCKFFNHLKQFFRVLSLLLRQLQVFLELICKFDLLLHESKAARKSDILV